MGKNGVEAAAVIEKENPYVMAIVLKEGSPVPADFRCDRVFVFVDDYGNVISTPVIT